MKKGVKIGQISVFIIISIVIVLGIIIVGMFAIKDNQYVQRFISRQSVSSEIMPVYNQIDVCIKQRAIDAIRIIGLQGGYINLKDYITTDLWDIGYGNINKNLLPSRQKMEEEINNYLTIASQMCIYRDSLSGFEIYNEKAKVNTKISNNDISISVLMPISASINNKTYRIDNPFYSQIKVNLGEMAGIANEVVNKELKDPNNIQLSYLSNINYYVLAMPHDNNTIIYAIIDMSNKPEIGNYSFVFASRLK